MFMLRILTFFISTITAMIMMYALLFTGNIAVFIISGIALLLEVLIFDLRRIYVRDKITDKIYKDSK